MGHPKLENDRKSFTAVDNAGDDNDRDDVDNDSLMATMAFPSSWQLAAHSRCRRRSHSRNHSQSLGRSHSQSGCCFSIFFFNAQLLDQHTRALNGVREQERTLGSRVW